MAAGQAGRRQITARRVRWRSTSCASATRPRRGLGSSRTPKNRRDAARAYIEQVGGALHGFWYGFGEYDGYAIYEAPDNASMAANVLAIAAGGALASVETTPLLTVEETLEALEKGKEIGYRRPGESPV